MISFYTPWKHWKTLELINLAFDSKLWARIWRIGKSTTLTAFLLILNRSFILGIEKKNYISNMLVVNLLYIYLHVIYL